MKKAEREHFKKILLERRNELVSQAGELNDPIYSIKEEELQDEVDLAATESDQNMTIRLRDRERTLLKKIDKALRKIENDDYGICESCGEDIGTRRLEARPVTDLCIRCKEEQEKMERSFAEDES